MADMATPLPRSRPKGYTIWVRVENRWEPTRGIIEETNEKTATLYALLREYETSLTGRCKPFAWIDAVEKELKALPLSPEVVTADSAALGTNAWDLAFAPMAKRVCTDATMYRSLVDFVPAQIASTGRLSGIVPSEWRHADQQREGQGIHHLAFLAGMPYWFFDASDFHRFCGPETCEWKRQGDGVRSNCPPELCVPSDGNGTGQRVCSVDLIAGPDRTNPLGENIMYLPDGHFVPSGILSTCFPDDVVLDQCRRYVMTLRDGVNRLDPEGDRGDLATSRFRLSDFEIRRLFEHVLFPLVPAIATRVGLRSSASSSSDEVDAERILNNETMPDVMTLFRIRGEPNRRCNELRTFARTSNEYWATAMSLGSVLPSETATDLISEIRDHENYGYDVWGNLVYRKAGPGKVMSHDVGHRFPRMRGGTTSRETLVPVYRLSAKTGRVTSEIVEMCGIAQNLMVEATSANTSHRDSMTNFLDRSGPSNITLPVSHSMVLEMLSRIRSKHRRNDATIVSRILANTASMQMSLPANRAIASDGTEAFSHARVFGERPDPLHPMTLELLALRICSSALELMDARCKTWMPPPDVNEDPGIQHMRDLLACRHFVAGVTTSGSPLPKPMTGVTRGRTVELSQTSMAALRIGLVFVSAFCAPPAEIEKDMFTEAVRAFFRGEVDELLFDLHRFDNDLPGIDTAGAARELVRTMRGTILETKLDALFSSGARAPKKKKAPAKADS